MAEYVPKELLLKTLNETENKQTCLDAVSKLPTVTLPAENCGVYQCFHCLSKSVIWDSDFDFSDYGIDGDGIVHVCHCGNCGAEIIYLVSCEDSK